MGNIVCTCGFEHENGGVTVGFSGYDGGRLKQRAAWNIHVPSYDMQKVEDLHLMLLHILFRLLCEGE